MISHALFPTLIGQDEYPDHSDFKEVFYKNIFKYINENGYSSENTGHVNIHHEEEFEDFYRYITWSISKYLDHLSIDEKTYDINIVKSWLNVIKDRETPNHSHADAHYSFTYYVNLPDDAVQPIVFHTPKIPHPNEAYLAMFANNVKEWNFFNSYTWEFTPKEGDIFVFPAHLRHHTYMKDGIPSDKESSFENLEKIKTKRICIAGDIVLTYSEKQAKPTGLQPVSNWKSF